MKLAKLANFKPSPKPMKYGTWPSWSTFFDAFVGLEVSTPPYENRRRVEWNLALPMKRAGRAKLANFANFKTATRVYEIRNLANFANFFRCVRGLEVSTPPYENRSRLGWYLALPKKWRERVKFAKLANFKPATKAYEIRNLANLTNFFRCVRGLEVSTPPYENRRRLG